jgi:hypothetical protein
LKVKRGPSQAVKDAKAFLTAAPETSAQFLSIKFGINLSTIYRSDWWKELKKVSQ